MATQVQIRGAISSTQNSRTLVSRELDIDTTNKRLNIHDGSTAGGIPHANYLDTQRNTFNYVAVSGTNALTGNLTYSPIAYQAGQAFIIKIANTNTGSVTLNLNSLGAKTVKKLFNGALTNMQSGDLISGQVVTVIYDGTNFQILSSGGSEAGKQSFTPTFVKVGGSVVSILLNDAFYVDYGDSVTISVDFSVNYGTFTPQGKIEVNNLPFAPIIGVSGKIIGYQGNSFDDFKINQSSNTMIMSIGGGGSNLQVTATYIKE